MERERDNERVSFLNRELSASFAKRVVTVAPGTSLAYRSEEWRDALVVVESGEVVLECLEEGRRRFPAGAVLWLAGLRLVALHNEGHEAAVLVAVSRRRAPPDDGDTEEPVRPCAGR
jgi:quercetin dioxygenase-like cupin family protein